MARLTDGSWVGAFEIEAFIGQGAFGITYLARHRKLGYRVALKEFFPRDLCFRLENGGLAIADASETPQFEHEKEVFIAEAQALTPFREHPNIVTVLDVFEANGSHYIVMEFIAGESLKSYIGSPSSPGGVRLATETETRFLLRRLLGALDALHALDPPLLHRDIKHTNIMVSDAGEPILIDFGAARAASPKGSRRLSTILTPGFAPYEQYNLSEEELEAAFTQVDPRLVQRLPPQGPPVDIYALGATCHFMLTGKAPPDALMRRAGLAHLPPLSARAGDRIGRDLLEGIDQALAQEPSDRFATANEWLDRLERSPEVALRPPPGRSPAPAKAPAREMAVVGQPVALGAPSPTPAWVALAVVGLGAAGLIAAAVWLSSQASRRAAADLPAVALAAPPSSVQATGPFQDCPDCPDMVRLPGGSFVMGSPAGEAGHRDSEAPQRDIALKPFALGATEVTIGQWRRCVEAGGCSDDALQRVGGVGDDRPIVFVTWHGARSYVFWLRERIGRKYRLPTEAEWEYAARAGSAGPYAVAAGEAPSANCSDCGSAPSRATPVRSYAANAFGLFDMQGNVWEWTEDCFQPDLSGKAPDGSASLAASCPQRTIRGGGFANPRGEMRAARRVGIPPDAGADSVGFRVARDL